MRILLVVVAVIVVVLVLKSRSRWPTLEVGIQDREARVRSYLDSVIARSRTPGLQYVVVDSSGTLLDYAGGWADIRTKVPMDSATTMMAYSMSKTITAAAVLRLVAAGQIGLDDPDSYTPRDHAPPARIHHLRCGPPRERLP